MIYKKLNLLLENFDFSNIISKEIIFYNGQSFTEFKIKNEQYLIDYLNKKIKFNIQYDECNFTKITFPGTHFHLDKWKTAMNYYPFEIPENEYTVMLTDPITKLEIKQHDCYLLNTHIHHKVFIPNKNSERCILRFTWMNKSIEEVYNSLEIF